ncbi:6-carboxytetrahydropterin synthase [Myxococcota bacterium]|nr:6-carboxytetrahydropterin synthase [Myxococcota bacterium]
MYRVRDEVMISASHQIPMPDGSLEPMHGHNWRIVVHVEAPELDPCGLVADFNELRAALTRSVDDFDHQHLNEVPPFDGIPSTAENLARVVFERLAKSLDDRRRRVFAVDVWMTDTGCARWEPR